MTIGNVHLAAYMRQSIRLALLNVSVIDAIAGLLFRREVDPIDLHMPISSDCFLRVSNRHAPGAILGRDLSDGPVQARHKRMLQDAALALLRGTGKDAKGEAP